jgi:uncharacterized protein YuzE
MTKITYDPEVKILSIRLQKTKSVDSELKENVVLDYDKKGRLVNIEIMDVNLEELMNVEAFQAIVR